MTFAMAPCRSNEKRGTPPSQGSLEDMIGSFLLGIFVCPIHLS